MEATQETGNLIASDKVQGTNVYNTAGDNLGAIHDLMIDKPSGKVASLSCPSAASLASETNIIRCPGRFSNTTPIWAVTLSISTSGNWKELQRTTSAPNQRGATAPTKARYTTITVSDPTGRCDLGARSACPRSSRCSGLAIGFRPFQRADGQSHARAFSAHVASYPAAAR